MPAARPLSAAADDQRGRPPLSSWYTQGLSDGLGDRLLMFDNQATGPLELLRVRPDFAFVPDFETRLRGRLDRLTAFSHPGFAQSRAVDHLDNGEGLTVVSTHVSGTRLSEIFPAARKNAGMHVAAARWALGELTAAMAALHGPYPGVAHGALAPERIVITADRHVVITDYIFGDALAAMHLPAERLWNECGVVSLPMRDLVPLDQRSDVVQLALIAMALVRGSRVTPDEYGRQRTLLLDEFSAACNREMPVSARALRAWMEEALDPGGFRSAVEANLALTELVNPMRVSERATQSAATSSAAEMREPLTVHPPAERGERRALSAAGDGPREDPDLPRRPLFQLLQWVAGALALIGVVQGAIIAGLVFRTSPTNSPASPASSQITAADGGLEPATISLPPKPGAVIASSQPAAATGTFVDGAPARGGVRIDSPIVLQVVEGTRTIGTSGGPIYLPAGSHDLAFVNSSLGVRTTATVRVTPGRVVPVAVATPEGKLSANAEPWARVLLDGRPIGDTPLANVAVLVGDHEVIFRNPQLGERRQRITVQAGTLTRVSASFAR